MWGNVSQTTGTPGRSSSDATLSTCLRSHRSCTGSPRVRHRPSIRRPLRSSRPITITTASGLRPGERAGQVVAPGVAVLERVVLADVPYQARAADRAAEGDVGVEPDRPVGAAGVPADEAGHQRPGHRVPGQEHRVGRRLAAGRDDGADRADALDRPVAEGGGPARRGHRRAVQAAHAAAGRARQARRRGQRHQRHHHGDAGRHHRGQAGTRGMRSRKRNGDSIR